MLRARGPLLILLLAPIGPAACSSGKDAVDEATASAAAREPAEGDEHVACALAGAAEFARVCAVERLEDEGTLFLTMRHPDGGFRRFEVLKDGRGLATADGADPAANALVGTELEVTVGKDRYRFPAKVADNAGQR